MKLVSGPFDLAPFGGESDQAPEMGGSQHRRSRFWTPISSTIRWSITRRLQWKLPWHFEPN